MAMSPGTIVGGYRIERVLGAGGMGTVYLAKHPQLPRMDALKVLSADLSRDAEFRGRFEREANIVAGLDHPNIVSVHNRGEEHGQLWIAMQYIEGTDASAEQKRDPHAMTPLRALNIVTQVGKGLDYAHRKGLLHRDVKPANFLLSTAKDDDEERALLADFGVAKSTEDTVELTQTGSFVATIAYAPPEQLAGQSLDHRADIYSLACSFFKLLTGQNPYPATQPALVMMGHLHEPPPRATAVNPHLPEAIDYVFLRALAKNPSERFATCREFTDAASNALTPGWNPVRSSTSPTYPVQVAPPGMLRATHESGPHMSTVSEPRRAVGGPEPKSRRGVLIAAGVGTVVVALAAGIGVWALNSGDSNAGNTTAATTSAAGVALTPREKARQENPAFKGKTVTMVDVTDPKDFKIYLGGTEQTKFLTDLGFVYNLDFVRQGDEVSPRAPKEYGEFKAPDNSYIVAVRSDEKAGNGGLLGLPYQITGSRAVVLPLDDPAAVAAMRTWTPDSEQTLIDKLVPVLRKGVK